MGVMTQELRQIMGRLAERRPIFHSEADFQHELGWEMRQVLPDSAVRLERPLTCDIRGAVDIALVWQGVQFGLELKYLTRKLDIVHDDEVFRLKAHGATDLRRYDVCKDVWRLERFNEMHGGSSMVVVLTNEAAYWRAPRHNGYLDADFRIFDGRVLSGSLCWHVSASPGTIRGRAGEVALRNQYQLAWQDYSDLGGTGGSFRYLLIDIP